MVFYGLFKCAVKEDDMMPYLSLLIWIPLFGAMAVAACQDNDRWALRLAGGVTVLSLTQQPA